jgi:hypothetical protein
LKCCDWSSDVCSSDLGPLATPSAVGEWVESSATSALAERARHVAEIEQVNDLPFVPVSSHPPPFAIGPARGVDLPTVVTPTPSSSSTPAGAAADAGALQGDGSQTDSLDLPAPTRSSRRRRAAIAGLSVIAVSWLLWAALVRQPTAVGSREPSSPGVSASAAPRPPTQAGGSMRDEPLVAAATNGSAEAAPPPPPPASTRVVTPRPSTPARSRPRPRPNCNPPYTLDDLGHRRYKMECL